VCLAGGVCLARGLPQPADDRLDDDGRRHVCQPICGGIAVERVSQCGDKT